MKKKLVFVMVLTMIAVLLFSGLAFAGGGKTKVCHLNASNDVVYGFLGVVDLHFGKMINIPEAALDAHLAHGDSVTFSSGQGPIDTFRGVGYHLPAADCWVNK